MRRWGNWRWRGWLAALIALSFGGSHAATAQDAEQNKKTMRRPRKEAATHQAADKSRVPIEFESPKTTFSAIVLEMSSKTRQSVALMNGTDPLLQVGPYAKKKQSTTEWMDRFTADAGLRIEHSPRFDFVYPSGYEVLNSDSVARRIGPGLALKTASLRVDPNTPLFSALALLSHSLGATIVADNIVSDARCGHVQLFDAPVGDGLDALLRSARVASRAVEVKAFDGAVLLYSAGRSLRDTTWARVQGESEPEWMDRQVSIYLPSAPTNPEHLLSSGRALPLRECLAELSRQTGLLVEADARVESLPVNPMALVQLPLGTALDLIVHQWPLPHFGYRATEKGARFVYLGPPIEK